MKQAISSDSGTVHGTIGEDARGGAIAAVTSPDPRWPLLNRWSQGSPSIKPPPPISVCLPAEGFSPASSQRLGLSPVGSQGSPPAGLTPTSYLRSTPTRSQRIGPPPSGSHQIAKSNLAFGPSTAIAPTVRPSPDGSHSFVVAEDSIDPGWPVLSRCTKPSPSEQPIPHATVIPLAEGPSTVKSTTNLLVGSSSLKITDYFHSSKPKPPLTDLSPTSLAVPKCHDINEPPTISVGKVWKELQIPHGPPSPAAIMNHVHTGLAPIVQPPLRGAWAGKLKVNYPSVSQQAGSGAHFPKKSPLDTSKEDNLRFPWAAKMDTTARNLYRATSPEYLEDGTPKVTIPSHVMMQGLENQKEYVIGQFYRCSLPPGGLVHAVVNRIWGRKCSIFSRKLSDSSFLFHIPDASTRAWVLQRGLWHVDDCLMFVAPWSTSETFDIPEIETIPVWVTLKNIPHRLYSIPGISHIASGLGAPMATYKPRLDPSLMGEAKILVEVELSKAFPPRIAAADKKGNIFMVNVEYGWIPSKCGECGQLGHKASRCTKPVLPQEGVTNFSTISTPIPVDSEVVVDTTLVIEVAPIQESTRVAVCHTHVEDAEIIDTLSNAGIGKDTEELEDNVRLTDREESIVLAGNRFSRLGYSFSDGHQSHSDGDSSVSDDSDNEFDVLVSLTPSGQRILRERPVQPSIKAKEVQASTIARGRGNRGRGHRGRRGRGNGGRG